MDKASATKLGLKVDPADLTCLVTISGRHQVPKAALAVASARGFGSATCAACGKTVALKPADG